MQVNYQISIPAARSQKVQKSNGKIGKEWEKKEEEQVKWKKKVADKTSKNHKNTNPYQRNTEREEILTYKSGLKKATPVEIF